MLAVSNRVDGKGVNARIIGDESWLLDGEIALDLESIPNNPVWDEANQTIVNGDEHPVSVERERIEAIKNEAHKIILEQLPIWRQNNLLARTSELLRKQSLTPEEETELDEMQQTWDWVKAIRTKSDEAETNGTPVDQIDWTV